MKPVVTLPRPTDAAAEPRPLPASAAGSARQQRALFLTRSLDYGGAERQLVELVRGLRERGRDVGVLVFYPGGPLEAILRAADVPVLSLEKRGRWDVAGFLVRLIGIVRSQRPAILHGYMDVPNIIVALLKPVARGARVVWGFRASDMELDRYDWLARAGFALERMLAPTTELIIVNSAAGIEHRARQGFPRDRMRFIPNGVDIDRFRPDQAARERVRGEWEIRSGERLIGLVARLDPMKDHPSFLAAAAEIARLRGDTRFVCVGNGPEEYRRELESSAHALELGDRLIWAPSRPDITAVYNALDLLCLSSAFGEGFPNVIGEAMACGIPCIATDVGDAAHIIGAPERVVPSRQPAALARAMLAALDSVPRDRPRGELRQRIVENFSTSLLIERTEAALWARD